MHDKLTLSSENSNLQTHKEFPKISIVTPSFNQAEFLEATINSILSQNYPNLEYIIIDGGSTDGSVEIIKKYEKFLHFWCSEKDEGQYAAINKGFSHATGEIMAWLNSDDMYFPFTLKTVASIMSELPEVEWLTTMYHGGADWAGFCRILQLIPGYSKASFLNGCHLANQKHYVCFIQQESTFWRKSLWQKTGGHLRTEFKLASDFDLWSRFFQHAELYITHSPLGIFRSQSNQKSRQRNQYISEAEKSLEEMRSLCNWRPDHFRNISLDLKLYRIPKLNRFITNRCSYTGKRVIRIEPDLPTGHWAIDEYPYKTF